ncbi:histidine phosphatase family protein [Kribbella sandramycini]|uniref:phosphoglycerate mutase (2,3-diphosphoglycerate-dependent) n=1 Tax=Kribbella sandramycini TaxID=60450 RepID=A0A7Y4KZJ9_9ACTN|nr:histidine phosphatase family protein [Kribbella sandramycini]MBB6565294.1 broad specificity phosphatase PhoE [Kribbella sandramycini]NOL41563.1 histidine phosphatase family protein [Kribbella sandramycini]
MGTRLIYETHATTLDNESGHATGWLPGELSERGRREAVELGERRRGVDVVFSSDLRRAVQTVELARLGVPHLQDWRLRECDYGELNGAPVDALGVRAERVRTGYPGGQSYGGIVELMRSFLDDVRRGYDGRVVLVVAHSAQRWALQHLVGGGAPLAEVIAAPFGWRPGWEYEL